MKVLEPDVTWTDYALAVECAVLATWIVRRHTPERWMQAWSAVFVGSLGLAAMTGGTVHGFFPDQRSLGYRLLWPLTMLAIGSTAVSAWAIGGRLVLTGPWARRLTAAAAVAFAGYALVVLTLTQAFGAAVAFYAPSALFLCGAFAARYLRARRSEFGLGAASLALMLLAAIGQRLGIAVHPVYFNHNALYHSLQGVALGLLYLAVRDALDSLAEAPEC